MKRVPTPPRFHGGLNQVHRSLGRSRVASLGAVLMRNQCSQVIRYWLSASDHIEENGEGLLIDHVASRCRTVVDVGANIGDWSARVFSRALGHPLALLLYEPQPACALRLRERFADTADARVIELALGEEPSRRVFSEATDNELSSLLRLEGNVARVYEVDVATLDAEIDRHGWSGIDFLKVDAEGYDLHVLRGARRLLESGSIGCIQFEYNRSWALACSTLAGAYALLEENAYTVFLIKSDGLWRLNYSRYGEYFSYSNFVAVYQDKMDWVENIVRGVI